MSNATPGSRPLRIGCVQWQMRAFTSVPAFLQLVEKQVAALASYRCDFAVFPEFFSAPLMTLTPELDTFAAMRALAAHSQAIIDAVSALAVKYQVNVIAGSLPVLSGKRLTNVACFCHRDGKIDKQAKLHPTPGEKADWDMRGGDKLRVIASDVARVGMLVCYDVEFPELPRLLAAQGCDILFVPFWTDSKQGYQRVRYCAQARAIENEMYVVLAGSVGTMPQLACLDVQYGQSAIFTPSDFGFPHDAIVNEATANVETLLVAEVELDKLARVREQGSVRNGEDRRHDLYAVKWLGQGKPGGKAATKRAGKKH
ncbi:MAG TPA: carbon-nitrogen hydrolase family protein [Candidatus Acidoferrum sp.]|nr:carbon-nitrogen hydrolase family protein [Candidatus Acidoferrum sp.]